MQDIRQELKERIRQNLEEEEKLQQQLAHRQAVGKGLVLALESENAFWERLVLSAPLFQNAEAAATKNGSGTLPALLLNLLRNGEVWTVDQFKTELDKRGYPFGDKAPGRVINFALVGMLNHGAVKKLGDKRWEIREKRATG